MTLIWLVVWVLSGTPSPHEWNGWAVSLCVCAAIDLFGAKK